MIGIVIKPERLAHEPPSPSPGRLGSGRFLRWLLALERLPSPSAAPDETDRGGRLVRSFMAGEELPTETGGWKRPGGPPDFFGWLCSPEELSSAPAGAAPSGPGAGFIGGLLSREALPPAEMSEGGRSELREIFSYLLGGERL